MITKKALYYGLGAVAAGSIATAAYAAISTKITTPGCSISGTSHKCNSGTRRDAQGLDPRAESFSTTGIDPDNLADGFDIRANYEIVDATRTTIFQMLNNDSAQSDTNKPVVFLTATKRSDGTYFICNGNSTTSSGCVQRNTPGGTTSPGVQFNGIPANFSLRLRRVSGSSSTDARLTLSYTVNGMNQSQSANLRMTKSPDGTTRTGGTTFPRWGVYMHNLNSSGRTTRTVEVKVSNVSLGSVG